MSMVRGDIGSVGFMQSYNTEIGVKKREDFKALWFLSVPYHRDGVEVPGSGI
jgi:hypothetical protein